MSLDPYLYNTTFIHQITFSHHVLPTLLSQHITNFKLITTSLDMSVIVLPKLYLLPPPIMTFQPFYGLNSICCHLIGHVSHHVVDVLLHKEACPLHQGNQKLPAQLCTLSSTLSIMS